RQGTKTRIAPARIPGAHSGIVTRHSATSGFAPRSAAASSKLLSSRSSVAYKGSTMNGKNPYTSPRITAPSLYSIGSGSRITPIPISAVLISPVSRSKNIHAYVRIRNDVQNGKITRLKYKFFRALLAINNASGNPSTRHNAVATPAIHTDRKKITPYNG